MLPGPIFNVELLTSARRTRYFFIRALYATILLIALGLVYQSCTYGLSGESVNIRFMARLSAAFFGTLGWVQLLAVVLLGPAMVAGTIATERERRTIEYLFASSLSNAEIVLGKLAARMVHVVYLVLAGVPIFALMMLLGGIAPESLLVLTIITLCTVLTISTLSIAVSVWSARAREAVTRAYLVLFVLTVIPPLLSIVLRMRSFNIPFIESVNEQFLAANPFVILTSIITTASGAMRGVAMDMLWTFARNHLILSAVLAAAATWGVRRAHLTQTTKAARRQRRFSHFFRPSVGNRPMLWKEVFAEPAAARLGMVGRIATALIVLAVVGGTIYFFCEALTDVRSYPYRREAEIYLGYAMIMGAGLATAGLLLVAARAAGSVTSERERDCWVSLISTPLEPGEIVWAKIAGSVWSIRGVAALLLLIWGMTVLLRPTFIIVLPFLFGTFLLLAFYAAALGVRFSLRCKNSLRAMAATLVTGLFVGGMYLFCCIPVLVAASPRSGEGASFMLAPCIPFLLGLPAWVYMAGDEFFRAPRDEGAIMLFAYIIGTVGYTIAGIALTGSSIASFDRIVGRTRLRTATSMSLAVSAKSASEPPREVRNELAVEAVLLPPEESV